DSFLPHIELTLAKISAPGAVCDVTVEDDGLSQFIPYMYWKPERHSVVLRLYENQIVGPTQQPHAGGPAPDDPGPLAPWPEGSYFGNPYPLRVVIRTTDGIRLLSTATGFPTPPKPPKLTPLEEVQLAVEKKIDCQTWAEWLPEKVFMPLWLPDPPIDQLVERVFEHYWQVTITRLDPGRELVITGLRGAMATAIADSNGIARVSILLSPEDDHGLTLAEHSAGAAANPQAAAALSVPQSLVAPVAEVDLPAHGHNV